MVPTNSAEFTAGIVRHERRMVHRVFREWIGLRRLAANPSINELNPKTFTTHWSWCFLARHEVENHSGSTELGLEFVGEKLLSDLPDCRERSNPDTVSSDSLLGHALRPLRWLFNQGTPALVQNAGPDARGRLWLYRTISLPFADSRKHLTYAFGAFSGMPTEKQVAAEIRSAETGVFIFREDAWIQVEE